MTATASQFFAAKTAVPSEMTTAQWDRVSLEMRERAFFMAAVSQAEVLQVYQNVTGQYVRGEVSEQEARRALREQLAATGYLPRPGEEGGIKDLRTGKRMDVVLRTNASMAANKAAYDKQLLAIKVFPAKRMVRMTPKRNSVPSVSPARCPLSRSTASIPRSIIRRPTAQRRGRNTASPASSSAPLAVCCR